MQQIFSVLKQALHRSILLLAIVSLLSLSGLSISLPSYAATANQKLTQLDKMDRNSQNANQREQAYEEQIQASKNPDKVYENNLKEFAKNNPNSDVVKNAVGEAKEILDKVTGKE